MLTDLETRQNDKFDGKIEQLEGVQKTQLWKIREQIHSTEQALQKLIKHIEENFAEQKLLNQQNTEVMKINLVQTPPLPWPVLKEKLSEKAFDLRTVMGNFNFTEYKFES